MQLRRLQVNNLRNIASAQLAPVAGLNRIIGPNGAGKTSLLEAIHFLATGRSFRRSGPAALGRAGSDGFTLFAEVGGGATHRLGVSYRGGQRELRLDGEPQNSHGSLARRLQTVHYVPESHSLANGGPGERRQLLDWGLFHVEPDYLELARRFQRALAQRNRWLKTDGRGTDPWAAELSQAGEAVAERRAGYAQRLGECAKPLFAELGGFGRLEVVAEAGWPGRYTLHEALEAERRRENPPHFTGVGPHRAELRLLLDGMAARERASRGQQKVLILALRLAQLALAGEEGGRTPVFLMDDVASELDAERRAAAMAILERVGSQVFVTATEDALCPEGEGEHATFRVAEGVIERSE